MNKEVLVQLKQGESFLEETGAKQRIQAYKIRKLFELSGSEEKVILPIKSFVLLLKRNRKINHEVKLKVINHYESLLNKFEVPTAKSRLSVDLKPAVIKTLDKKKRISGTSPKVSMSFLDMKVLKIKKWVDQNGFFIFICVILLSTLFYFKRKQRAIKGLTNSLSELIDDDVFSMNDTFNDSLGLGINVKDLLEEKLILKESFLESKHLDDIFVHAIGNPYYFGNSKYVDALFDSLVVSIAKLKIEIEKTCDIKLVGSEKFHSIEICFNNFNTLLDNKLKQSMIEEYFYDIEKLLAPLNGKLDFKTRNLDGINEFMITIDYQTNAEFSLLDDVHITP